MERGGGEEVGGMEGMVVVVRWLESMKMMIECMKRFVERHVSIWVWNKIKQTIVIFFFLNKS